MGGQTREGEGERGETKVRERGEDESQEGER